jgi:hypothetical protein
MIIIKCPPEMGNAADWLTMSFLLLPTMGYDWTVIEGCNPIEN